MFAKLRGIVDSVQRLQHETWLILDVHGIGYQVFCSEKTLQTLPAAGGSTALYIETHVREDRIQLFGFSTEEEKTWFRILNSVQGVGTKVALGILSHFTSQQLVQIITAQDKNLLTKAEGVGPKLASRLVTELKDRAAAFGPMNSTVIRLKPVELPAPADDTESNISLVLNDAVSALINLGYSRSESYHVVAKFYHQQPDIALADLIRESLRELRL